MQIRWHPYQRILSSRTVVVVWLGLAATTNQAVAEAANSTDRRISSERRVSSERRAPFERRASSRIGVSVTVLPSCAISVSGALGLDGQPVTVVCTKDTLYTISASAGPGQISATGLPNSAEQALAGLIRQSNGQADLFTLKNAQVTKETLVSGNTEVTVLSIDF